MLTERIEVDIAVNAFFCSACGERIGRGDRVFIVLPRSRAVIATDFRCRECGETKLEMLRSHWLRKLPPRRG